MIGELLVLIFAAGVLVHYCQLREKNAKLAKRVNRRERTWDDDDEPTQEHDDWEVVNEGQKGERVKFKTKNFSFTYRSFD